MDLEDEAIEHIGAAIKRLRQKNLLQERENVPLRLYRTRGGEFVRVLDDDTAPLTPEMLRAIEAYTTSAVVESAAVDNGNGSREINLSANEMKSSVLAPLNPKLENSIIHDKDSRISSSTSVSSYVREQDGQDVGFEDHNIAMCDGTEVPKIDTTIAEEETPGGLVNAGMSVDAWFNDQSASERENDSKDDEVYVRTTALVESADPVVTDDPIETLMLHWPREICERTRLCYGLTRGYVSPPRCVVYWLRNTLRVNHGNFALAAAQELADHYALPVIAVYLAPSSIMYPVRHASGINDALTRWSVAEVRRHLWDNHKIEMFAFSPQEVWRDTDAVHTPALDGGSGLYTLLDAFHPVAVVTDDGISLAARVEVDCLRQFLQTRVRAPWPLLAVDSMTCVPFQLVSDVVRKSLHVDTAQRLSEDEFANEYASLLQLRDHFSISLDPSRPTPRYQVSIRVAIKDDINAAMNKVQVEEIMWDIVEEMTTQAAKSIAAASELIGLQRLESLVSVIDDRPAVQQELQGSGILSLVPFVRHGSLFSGYVHDRLAIATASMPRPTDAKSRKAFATLKVLRSRASSHLAKERDYGLYLSLWATQQVEREAHVSGRAVPFLALSSFKTSLSELDAYKYLLPSWISPNKSLGGSSRQTAVYDPYQLESGRTDDQYWNEIQLFLIEHRYVHPLVMVYWAYRILQWSISTRAGIATIEGLLDKCCLGSLHSSDTNFSLWNTLFHIGKTSLDNTEVAFVERVEAELAAQPRLQFHK